MTRRAISARPYQRCRVRRYQGGLAEGSLEQAFEPMQRLITFGLNAKKAQTYAWTRLFGTQRRPSANKHPAMARAQPPQRHDICGEADVDDCVCEAKSDKPSRPTAPAVVPARSMRRLSATDTGSGGLGAMGASASSEAAALLLVALRRCLRLFAHGGFKLDNCERREA
jgi:hypothetical protein